MLDDNSDYAVTVFHFRSQFLARATRHTFFYPLGNNRRAATCFFFFPFPFCSFILFYLFFFSTARWRLNNQAIPGESRPNGREAIRSRGEYLEDRVMTEIVRFLFS